MLSLEISSGVCLGKVRRGAVLFSEERDKSKAAGGVLGPA